MFIESNICLFAHGDVIHCNPKPYRTSKNRLADGHKANDPWKKSYRGRKVAKDIWWKDDGITRELEEQGKIVLTLWEDELTYDTEKCRQKIIDVVRKSKESLE